MGYQNDQGQFVALGSEILTLAQLKSIIPVPQYDKHALVRLTDGREFYYHTKSTLVADDLFVIAPTAGPGRYLLAPGIQRVPLACGFGTADNAVLATCPTGFLGRVLGADWGTPTASFTGGTSSAIGLHSSKSPHNTKGDILGGASGNVAADLTTGGFRRGTVGADVAAGVVLEAADTIVFGRITSAFTAGATVAGVTFHVMANHGA